MSPEPAPWSVIAPPMPPLDPPEVVIPFNVTDPAEVIETAAPLLVFVPAVLITPPMLMGACVVDTLNEKLPVTVELRERSPVPMCVSEVLASSSTGPLKVTVVPCVDKELWKTIKFAVTDREPGAWVGPNTDVP